MHAASSAVCMPYTHVSCAIDLRRARSGARRAALMMRPTRRRRRAAPLKCSRALRGTDASCTLRSSICRAEPHARGGGSNSLEGRGGWAWVSCARLSVRATCSSGYCWSLATDLPGHGPRGAKATRSGSRLPSRASAPGRLRIRHSARRVRVRYGASESFTGRAGCAVPPQ